jgi:KDO2-lipid IV(A) lauroyltransferase
MASVKHNVEYLATLFGYKLAEMMPPRLADVLGAGLGSLAYRLLTSRRRIARDNLRNAFGDELSEERIDAVAREAFRSVGRSVVDFMRFEKLGSEWVNRVVESDARPTVERVLSEGNGLIVVTPHFGDWELGGVWYAAQGFPCDILVGVQHNEKVDALANRMRTSIGASVIPVGAGLRSVFKSLQDNHILGIAPDQHAPSGRLILEFFGRPASVAKGPALFSLRTGAPILPFLLARERYDKHVMKWAEPIYPLKSDDEERDVQAITQQYMKFFEDQIRLRPGLWMWTHRRWKVDVDGNKSVAGA